MTAPDDEQVVRIVLSEEQQRDVLRQSGMVVPWLDFTRDGIVALELAAMAVRAGMPVPGMLSPIVLALDAAQRDQVRRATRVEVGAVAFDPDSRAVACREDWSSSDQPLELPGGLRIVPAVPGAAPAGATDVAVHVGDQGQDAFGTGRHPTTRLTAGLLVDLLPPTARVADVGTGSGVLAIGAMRLGAREVVAFETEVAAAALARRNVDLNGAADVVTVRDRTIADSDGTFDLVLANLFPNVLLSLASVLAAATAPGGMLVASGFVAARRHDVEAAFDGAGLRVTAERRLDGWGALALSRPA